MFCDQCWNSPMVKQKQYFGDGHLLQIAGKPVLAGQLFRHYLQWRRSGVVWARSENFKGRCRGWGFSTPFARLHVPCCRCRGCFIRKVWFRFCTELNSQDSLLGPGKARAKWNVSRQRLWETQRCSLSWFAPKKPFEYNRNAENIHIFVKCVHT